jgi:hypothetical protein
MVRFMALPLYPRESDLGTQWGHMVSHSWYGQYLEVNILEPNCPQIPTYQTSRPLIITDYLCKKTVKVPCLFGKFIT